MFNYDLFLLHPGVNEGFYMILSHFNDTVMYNVNHNVDHTTIRFLLSTNLSVLQDHFW